MTSDLPSNSILIALGQPRTLFGAQYRVRDLTIALSDTVFFSQQAWRSLYFRSQQGNRM